MMTLCERARNEPDFEQFKTFDDEKLRRMLEAAKKFESDFLHNNRPSWLTFLGRSGTGKTFLARLIFEKARRVPGLAWHRDLIQPVLESHWPQLLSSLRNGRYYLLDDLRDCNFLFLDELAIEHDPTGFAADKLCELLSQRQDKWTLLTTNLTSENIGIIDERILSRMVRGRSVLVDSDTVDFASRNP